MEAGLELPGPQDRHDGQQGQPEDDGEGHGGRSSAPSPPLSATAPRPHTGLRVPRSSAVQDPGPTWRGAPVALPTVRVRTAGDRPCRRRCSGSRSVWPRMHHPRLGTGGQDRPARRSTPAPPRSRPSRVQHEPHRHEIVLGSETHHAEGPGRVRRSCAGFAPSPPPAPSCAARNARSEPGPEIQAPSLEIRKRADQNRCRAAAAAPPPTTGMRAARRSSSHTHAKYQTTFHFLALRQLVKHWS